MKIVRDFWPAAELRSVAEEVLFGTVRKCHVLQRGGPGLRELIEWSREDAPELWDTCLGRLPVGTVQATYVIRYGVGVELVKHHDNGCTRLVVLVRAADGGGELSVEGTGIEMAVGDAVIFDDSLRHEVSMVTAGERWTLTMGVWAT